MGRAVADDRSKSNRIATLNAAPPRAGIHIPKAKDLRKPETTNLSLSLGVPKGVFSFAKENIHRIEQFCVDSAEFFLFSIVSATI